MMYIIANCAMPSQQLIFSDVLTKNEEFSMTVDMQSFYRTNIFEFIWGIITLYYMNLLICGLQKDFDNLSFFVIECQNVSLMD